jgi:tetratricopeptide (TPR) repeat protein
LEGNYGAAEEGLKSSLAASERSYGSSHLCVAQSLADLAIFYCKIQKYAEVHTFHSIPFRSTTFRTSYSHSLRPLWRWPQAEALFKRAITIREEVLGENNTRMAASLQQLAYLYTALGRYVEATNLYNRSLAILQSCLDQSHPDITDALNKLAWLQLKCGSLVPNCPLPAACMRHSNPSFL